MKELFSAFQRELFRPLVTLLIPGLIAICPYLLLRSLWQTPDFSTAFTQVNSNALAVIAVALFVGMLLEEVGSHLEAGWDELLGSRHIQEWYWYLRQAPDPEPIAYRYIRSLVLRLKFLLASYLSITLALPGVAALSLRLQNPLISYSIVAAFALIGFFLRYEAQVVHSTLAKTRRELVKAQRLGSDPLASSYNVECEDDTLRQRMIAGAIVIVPLTFISIFRPSFIIDLVALVGNLPFTKYCADPIHSVTIAMAACATVLLLLIFRSSARRGTFARLFQRASFALKHFHRPALRSVEVICICDGSDEMRLAGNTTELGNWSTEASLLLKPDGLDEQGCRWRGTFQTELNTFECKLLERRSSEVRWESGDNRIVNLTKIKTQFVLAFRNS